MKKSILVTVDADAWLLAKEKLPNISAYVNECLLSLTGSSKEDDTEQKLKEDMEKARNSIQESGIKLAIAEMELKKLKERKEIEKAEALEREKFNRWVCSVCKHENPMELTERCGQCNLPTRKDGKTKIINIKDKVE